MNPIYHKVRVENFFCIRSIRLTAGYVLLQSDSICQILGVFLGVLLGVLGSVWENGEVGLLYRLGS